MGHLDFSIIVMYMSLFLYYSGKDLDNKELMTYGVNLWYIFICDVFMSFLSIWVYESKLVELIECENLTTDQKLKLMDSIHMDNFSKIKNVIKKFK